MIAAGEDKASEVGAAKGPVQRVSGPAIQARVARKSCCRSGREGDFVVGHRRQVVACVRWSVDESGRRSAGWAGCDVGREVPGQRGTKVGEGEAKTRLTSREIGLLRRLNSWSMSELKIQETSKDVVEECGGKEGRIKMRLVEDKGGHSRGLRQWWLRV